MIGSARGGTSITKKPLDCELNVWLMAALSHGRTAAAGLKCPNLTQSDEWHFCLKYLTKNFYCVDADQYKYGKNRVEADAKRLQSKEEELLRRKETLRNRLAQLRKERKDLRAALEVNTGKSGI